MNFLIVFLNALVCSFVLNIYTKLQIGRLPKISSNIREQQKYRNLKLSYTIRSAELLDLYFPLIFCIWMIFFLTSTHTCYTHNLWMSMAFYFELLRSVFLLSLILFTIQVGANLPVITLKVRYIIFILTKHNKKELVILLGKRF